jgi:hypothetical protein
VFHVFSFCKCSSMNINRITVELLKCLATANICWCPPCFHTPWFSWLQTWQFNVVPSWYAGRAGSSARELFVEFGWLAWWQHIYNRVRREKCSAVHFAAHMRYVSSMHISETVEKVTHARRVFSTRNLPKLWRKVTGHCPHLGSMDVLKCNWYRICISNYHTLRRQQY